MTRFITILCLVLSGAGCASHKDNWRNHVVGGATSNLAGIIIEQLPETSHNEAPYKGRGKHPWEVHHVYWDGSVQIFQYSPRGELLSVVWAIDPLKPGDPSWQSVDYSFGSDPEFKEHHDPRLKVKDERRQLE